MDELFASGGIASLILALMIVEGIALNIYWQRTGRGVAPAGLWINLLAGGCLILALHSALTGSWWGWTAAFLGLGFAAHLADLWQRWHG